MARGAEPRFSIEDRRKYDAKVYGSGKFVLWEYRSNPFPHRAMRGAYATRREASEAAKELQARYP